MRTADLIPLTFQDTIFKTLASANDVDDEYSVVNQFECGLRELGYRVVCCTSGQEALMTFSADPDGFDLLVTDQTMPGMTGAELATKILKIRTGLPIILCTGYSNLIDEKRAQELGIAKFLFQPV